jgi:hypothetical protein
VSTVFPYQKSVHTHATKHATNRVGKTSLKNCQILENVLGILSFPSPILRFPSPKIRFSSPKIQFSLHEIQFTQIGFLLSSTAFRFLQQLSDFLQRLFTFSNDFPNFSNGFPIFLNGFPLSEKSKKIYLWREVYERSIFELRIFRHSLPELCSSRQTIPTSHPTYSFFRLNLSNGFYSLNIYTYPFNLSRIEPLIVHSYLNDVVVI